MFKKGNQESVGKGRPIGSKNRLSKAIEIFESLGMSPLTEACKELAKITDPETRFNCYMELASYAHAKPREPLNVDMEGIESLVIIRKEKVIEVEVEKTSMQTALSTSITPTEAT